MSEVPFSLTFLDTPWYRDSYVGRIEERPARIEDMVAAGKIVVVGAVTVNFTVYKPATANGFKFANPKYQQALDMYLGRRTVENLSAWCEVNSGTFTATDMANFLSVEDNNENEEILMNGNSMLLGTDWMLVEIDCKDMGDTRARITGKWRKYGAWTLVEV